MSEKSNELFRRKEERTPESLGGRSHYFRDYQAILHSVALRRLRHKTQVFFLAEDDAVCTRLEHVLTVASIAMTICKSLALDQELAMAIGTGHDLGHPPFGHAGEEAINSLSLGITFHHETHGARVVEHIERCGKGLNLTYAVRDGIAHHSGESDLLSIRPRKDKYDDSDLSDFTLLPATFEGCVVRLADRIAFIGRDLVDAVHAQIIKPDSIPRDALHKIGCLENDPQQDPMGFNSRVIDYFVQDLINTTRQNGKSELCFSSSASEVMKKLYAFSGGAIYMDEQIKRGVANVKKIISTLYQEFTTIYNEYGFAPDKFMNHIPGVNYRAHVVGHLGAFIKEHEAIYLTLPEGDERRNRLLVDFIATLSDNEAVRAFQDLVYPKSLI